MDFKLGLNVKCHFDVAYANVSHVPPMSLGTRLNHCMWGAPPKISSSYSILGTGAREEKIHSKPFQCPVPLYPSHDHYQI